MKLSKDIVYGVSLGGGGARGSYEIGVIKALNEEKIKIGCIVGTSVGAINGALVAMGEEKLAFKLWRELTPDKVYREDGTLIERVRDFSKLKKFLSKYIDEEKIRKSDIDFGIVAFDVTTMKEVCLFKEDIKKGQMLDYIIASANFPTFYRQEIDGHKFIDGGVSANLPTTYVYDRGYKDIIEVDINHLISVTSKRVNAKDANVHTIDTKESLHGVLLFDNKTINENIKRGYLDLKKYNEEFVSYKYYIKNYGKNDSLNHLSDLDIKNIYLDEHLSSLRSEKVFKEYITVINKFDTERDFYDIKSKKFFLNMLEITAEILMVDVLKEYTYNEFLKAILIRAKKSIRRRHTLKRLLRKETYDPKHVLFNLLFYISNKTIRDSIFFEFKKVCIAFLVVLILIKKFKRIDKDML